jgi:hypothetical protein
MPGTAPHRDRASDRAISPEPKPNRQENATMAPEPHPAAEIYRANQQAAAEKCVAAVNAGWAEAEARAAASQGKDQSSR